MNAFQLAFPFTHCQVSPEITSSWGRQEEIKAGLPAFLVLERPNSSITVTIDLNNSVLFCSVSCHGYLAKVIYTPK